MAKNVKGITIEFRGETTKLERALKTVKKESSEIDKELRNVNRELKFNPSNVELIAQKQTLLKEKIQASEQALKQFKEMEKDLKGQGVDENSAEFRTLRQNIIKAESQLKNFKKELNSISSAKLTALGNKAKEVGNKIQSAGRKMQGLSATTAMAGGAAVAVAADFDKSMSYVQALTGATGDEFEALRNKAREMGATTKFSATEAGEAMGYMALAGWKTKDMLNGLEGILNLAAAAGTDLATTSDIVTDSLTAMGYSAEDAGRMADVMAAAQANSNVTVETMGETFQYAAAVAGSLGYSMEDLALATGLMGNAGIKGSQAGTSLRSMMTNLAAPTKEGAAMMSKLGISLTDAEGKMKPLRVVIEEMRASFAGLSETEQTAAAKALVGKNAMTGFLSVINASESDFNKLEKAIDGSAGSAEDMSEVMLDNLGGQLTILKSGLQEMGIAMSETLTPIISAIAEKIQGLVSWFNDLSEGQQRAITIILLLTSVAGPLLTMLGIFIGALGQIILFGQTLIPVLAGVGAAEMATLGPILLLVAGIAAVIAIGVLLYKNWDTIKAKAKDLAEFLKVGFLQIWEWTKKAFTGIGNAMISPFKKAYEFIKKAVEWIKSMFPINIGNILGKIKLPHFGIKPKGWKPGDLLQGSIPTLGVNWYKTGGIFNSPSIIGVGEGKSSEAVMPLDKFWAKMDNLTQSIVSAIQLGLSGRAQAEAIDLTVNLGGAKVGEEIVRLYDRTKKAVG